MDVMMVSVLIGVVFDCGVLWFMCLSCVMMVLICCGFSVRKFFVGVGLIVWCIVCFIVGFSRMVGILCEL